MLKALSSLAFASLLLLTFGTAFAPDNPMFWLASNDGTFMLMRIVLLVVLYMQLVTKPPRHLVFRAVAGVIAGLTMGWVWHATYGYQMELMDTLAFAGAAIAITVAALEQRMPHVAKVYRTTSVVR